MSRRRGHRRRLQVWLAYVSSQLAVFCVLWLNAVWVADDFRRLGDDHYIFNVRLAFWIYAVEFFVELFLTSRRFYADKGFGFGAVGQSAVQAGFAAVLQLVGRWLAVIILTWLLSAIPSPFAFLPTLAALAPTVIWHSCRGLLTKESAEQGEEEIIRGAKVMSFAEAKARLHRSVGRDERDWEDDE